MSFKPNEAQLVFLPPRYLPLTFSTIAWTPARDKLSMECFISCSIIKLTGCVLLGLNPLGFVSLL